MTEIIPPNITLPTQSVHNARCPSGNKELVAHYNVITFDRNAAPSSPENGFFTPITAKCWMGKSRNASVVYACVWIYGEDKYWSGKGQVGGYGYDKISAAIDFALRDAGVNIGYSFGGAGETATNHALSSIARALGYTTFFVLRG